MFKVKWIITAALLGAATVQLTLMAAGAAPGAPAGNGPPNRDAASVTLAPSPRVVACDGADASTVTVRIEDAQGHSVPDGTIVHFDAVYGYTEPDEAATRRGEAATDVRFYPYAQNYPGRTELRVFASGMRASVGIDCAPPEPGCDPNSPPQHPMSPPCEPEPGCNQPFSPPLHPMSPPCGTPGCLSFDSPPCVVPTPCIPVVSPPSCFTPTPTPEPCDPLGSPPCPTPTPAPPSCADAIRATPTPVNEVSPLYGLYAYASEDAGAVTVMLGIKDLGGGNYQSVQWELCYDPAVVDVLTIGTASGAPVQCSLKSDNAIRVLAGCIDIFGDNMSHFGDAWVVRFTCIAAGQSAFRLTPERSFVYRSRVRAARTTSDNNVTCTTLGPPALTPTPTPTPPPATPWPAYTSTPAATATPTSVGIAPWIMPTHTPTPTPTKPGNRR